MKQKAWNGKALHGKEKTINWMERHGMESKCMEWHGMT
jgi:hypothetical protein